MMGDWPDDPRLLPRQTIVRDPELAAVLAELQRASACLIRIEELLNKPIASNPSPPADWDWVRRPLWWRFW